ncbi:MAG: alkaline phosphatase [Chthoniobacterales bacterium]
MKLRNRLIALICFLLFVAIGTTYFFNEVIKKPFSIILFVGDGMSSGVLTATRLYQGGADQRLTMEEFPQLALTRTYGNDFAVSDAASAATALATGERVNHQTVGVDIAGKPLLSLLEEAASHDRAVGIISNGSLVGETAAAFYAKSLNSQDLAAIAKQLTEHSLITLLVGGGRKEFKKEITNSSKKSNLEKTGPLLTTQSSDLLEKLTNKGYVVANSFQELAAIPTWKSSPVIGLLADNDFSFRDELHSEADQPSLAELLKQSIQRLQHYRHGYFLVVDDALLAKAASLNNAEQLFHEVIDFDQAVATARQYAGPNALIVITGKQNLGGLSMNGYPFRNDKGVAVLGLNAQGSPSITWSTGPGYNVASPNALSDGAKENPSILAEPSAFSTPSALGVADDTVTLGAGPGSDQIHGFIDLTTIHDLLKKQL